MRYDRLDWHVEAALEAGQPPEHAFAHIGLYLAWLIRHDLHDPASFPPAHVAAVKAGEMTGSDLADDVDGKLVGVVMTSEGEAFSDARYEAYTAAFEAACANAAPYSVADDESARALIDPILDDLYAAWVAAGRPKPTAAPARPDQPSVLRGADLDGLQASIDRFSTELRPPTPMSAESHEAPELEALIPADLTHPPMTLMSVNGTEWGASLQRRTLKRLDVRPADTIVVNALGGRGHETLTVMLFSVPGIDRDRLLVEFRTVIFLPRGSWQTRVVAGRSVEWMTVPEFSTAFWTNDGLVIQVSGRADLVEAAIPRLP